MASRAAQRYAKALLDLAYENQNQEAINTEIRSIDATLKNSQELRNVLKSPVIKPSSKVASLKAIFKNSSKSINNLFEVLARNNRISDLHWVTKKFIELYDERNNIKVAKVTTAVPLTKELETAVLNKVQKITGGDKVTLKNTVDQSILGGFILRIGDKQYDASVAGKLNRLKQKFKNKTHV